ncbi:MAG: GNAT family N-acetyltransferase [Alphaproteobacteria bacterium]
MVSTDPDLLDIDLIYNFLTQSDWAQNIPRQVVARSIANSINFGLYAEDGDLIGYGRVVTDRATFAYISDVLIIEEQRRKGFGSWLVRCMFEHPDLQGLRRWQLTSSKAQGFYTRLGFTAQPDATAGLAKVDANVYSRARHQTTGHDINSGPTG